LAIGECIFANRFIAILLRPWSIGPISWKRKKLMISAPLSTLFYENRGNISDKWEQYLAVYETELGAFRSKTISLLEVGVQNGGSMQVWASYFGATACGEC
jgi:hypothetical protein